jgi:hypothetical protein
MLGTPTEIMGVKLALMLVVILVTLFFKKKKFWEMNSIVYGVIFVILLHGVYNISSAVINQTMTSTELIRVLPFNLIHPILYFLLIPAMMGDNIKRLCYGFVIIYFLLIFRDLINVLALLVGFTPPFVFSEGEIYNVTESSIGFNSGSHYSMMYLMPVFFTLAFTGKLNKKLLIFGFLLTILQVALSGSAALIIIFVLCMSIPFFVKILIPKHSYAINLKYFVFILLTVVSVGLYYFISSGFFEAAFDNFVNHFDSTTDLRYEQRQVLLDGWKQAPIWGQGYGASFVTSARGRESQFESMYHSTLATTGIVGLLFILTYYFLIIIYTYKLIKRTQSPYYLSLLFCFFSSILCSTTNPALATFDGLIPIYACLACIAANQDKKHVNLVPN